MIHICKNIYFSRARLISLFPVSGLGSVGEHGGVDLPSGLGAGELRLALLNALVSNKFAMYGVF